MSKEAVIGDENSGRGEFVQDQATGEVLSPDRAEDDKRFEQNTKGPDSWREQP